MEGLRTALDRGEWDVEAGDPARPDAGDGARGMEVIQEESESSFPPNLRATSGTMSVSGTWHGAIHAQISYVPLLVLPRRLG